MAGQGVIGWKITIGDSLTATRVVTSRTTRWADVPSRIICIMLYLDDGRRRIIGNRDFYWFVGNGANERDWRSGFSAPSDRSLVVKDGFLLTTPTYERAQDDAMKDLSPV